VLRGLLSPRPRILADPYAARELALRAVAAAGSADCAAPAAITAGRPSFRAPARGSHRRDCPRVSPSKGSSPAPQSQPRAPQIQGAKKTGFIADSVGRHAEREAVAGSPCATPCPARRPGRSAPGFPGGVGNGSRMEARQGAIRVFSGNTFPAAAPRSPPFRLRPMRDPANRPLARTSAGTPPAFSPAQASQDRASGVRGGRLRCAYGRTSAPTGDEDGGIGISPQNADGPLPRFPPSAVPDASTHAWSNPRPPPCPDTIPLHCGVIKPVQAVVRSPQRNPR
jgi:hypothetical protein